MSKFKISPIRPPAPEVRALHNTVSDLKEAMEVVTGQKGNVAFTVLYLQPTPPADPVNPSLWIDTDDYKLRVWDGTAWRNVIT